MDARTLTFCRSLRRAVAVVDAHPDLRAHAAESKAFELFAAAVDTLETLHREETSSRRELKELAARKRALAGDIIRTIERLCATAALLPPSTPALPTFAPPSPRLFTNAFTTEARAIVELTAERRDAFIASGLHPRTFDVARDQITQLDKLDHGAAYTLAHSRSFNNRLDLALDHARKRRDQLYLELQPALNAHSYADWRTALALGRTHRPKLLPAPPEQKLLTAPKPEGDQDVVAAAAPQPEGAQDVVADSPPSDGGIKRLARRVGFRLARGDTA